MLTQSELSKGDAQLQLEVRSFAGGSDEQIKQNATDAGVSESEYIIFMIFIT